MTTIVRASPRQSCSCCGTQVLAAVKDVNGTTVLHVQDRRHGTVHLRYFSLPDLVRLLDPRGTSFTAI